jgi:hypothetical protein
MDSSNENIERTELLKAKHGGRNILIKMKGNYNRTLKKKCVTIEQRMEKQTRITKPSGKMCPRRRQNGVYNRKKMRMRNARKWEAEERITDNGGQIKLGKTGIVLVGIPNRKNQLNEVLNNQYYNNGN